METRPQVLTYEETQALARLDDDLTHAVARVAEIDLAPVIDFVARKKRWTSEQAGEAESFYRRFLALCLRYPDRKICPTGPVDDVWHAHILDTEKYATDCAQLFGETLHHFPYFGMRGPEDRAALESAFDDTVDLFIRHFGVDPTDGDTMARSCRPQRCP